MTLSKLAELIEIAVYGKAPQIIRQITGDYYQPYYYFFYLLSKATKNGKLVELGVNKGWGTFSLALGNPDLTVVGFDHNVEPVHTLPNVDFRFQSALPPAGFGEREIAVLHIDTEHSYGNARNEFYQYTPYLMPGAVVCFDDLHAMDNGVLQAFYELPYPKIQDDRLHPVNGYGVLIYDI